MNPNLMTDRYELSMLITALRTGTVDRRAIFEAFPRRLPDGRGFGMVAGTERLIEMIRDLRFDADTIQWLLDEGVIDDTAAQWLSNFQFPGTITGLHEGDVYFPGTPVLTVESTYGEGLIKSSPVTVPSPVHERPASAHMSGMKRHTAEDLHRAQIARDGPEPRPLAAVPVHLEDVNVPNAPDAVELAKTRFALASDEMVGIVGIGAAVPEPEAQAEIDRLDRHYVPRLLLLLVGMAVGYAGFVASMMLSGFSTVTFVMLALTAASTASALWVANSLQRAVCRVQDRSGAWDEVPVPRNVRDAYARIKGVAERDDVPEWVITTALHAERVVVEIAEHHANGTGSGAACGRLADALFTAAAQIDTWDLMSRTADVDDEVESADALLMLEAATATSDILAVESAETQEVPR